MSLMSVRQAWRKSYQHSFRQNPFRNIKVTNLNHRKFNLKLGYKTSVLRDYSLDNKSQGRQSLSSQKHGPESDTDSMAEYGDGDTGKKMIWSDFPLITLCLV